ncbi:MAG TPA: hypothetical protein VL154_13085 [Acetobacteraceae bacterium]|jgi:hypothetical protein|nr:hypothetical protein [Acetobacteraceae bacterium]
MGGGQEAVRVTRLTNEDIERLASRVAMLASDDGEADNAGRAVGQLARRLGLTGGDLKHMFLDGARPDAQATRARGHEVERLERELEELRRNLRSMEAAARVIQWERDELLTEKGELTVRLYRGRALRRSRRIALAAGAALVLLVGGTVAMLGPDLGSPRVSVERPTSGIAIVRSAHARLLSAPKTDAALVVAMPPGTRLVVRRVLWNMMMQWAEVEMGRLSGYVPTTDLEMF